MKLLVLICAGLAASFAPNLGSTKIHKFEDGFVERTVAIIVRDKTAHVEYSIGLNESTVRELLASWEQSSTQKKTQSDSPDPPITTNSEIEPSGVERRDQPAGTVQSSPRQSSQPKNKTDAINGLYQSAHPTLDKQKKPTAGSATESANSEGGHVIAPQLMARFANLAPTAITKSLNIRCDGKPIAVGSVALGPAPRHPFTLTVKFQFEFPESDSCKLEITDGNFAKQSGAVRYALKATGNAMLLQTNVAPILVRSDRIELSELSDADRAVATSITARVGFISSTRK